MSEEQDLEQQMNAFDYMNDKEEAMNKMHLTIAKRRKKALKTSKLDPSNYCERKQIKEANELTSEDIDAIEKEQNNKKDKPTCEYCDDYGTIIVKDFHIVIKCPMCCGKPLGNKWNEQKQRWETQYEVKK